MEYILQTNSLSKTYKNHKALDDLSISIPKNSIYGLVGKNGAGKTTLIRIITGLQKASSGNFRFFGKETEADIQKARRKMGAIIETPSIYGNMSAYENLYEQALILGLPSYERIDECLKLTGLDTTGKKKAKNFSLGMKQRLGIAIALLGNPDFLVLDEPINGLDPQGIVEIRELILKLNREEGITFLISSHILSELSLLATHYGIIDNGKAVKEISAEELSSICRKCINIKVDNIDIFARVLSEMNAEFNIGEDNDADIFGEINIVDLAVALKENHCQILKIREKDENLESYFISLVGGSKHD